jgi:hypothetical protein
MICLEGQAILDSLGLALAQDEKRNSSACSVCFLKDSGILRRDNSYTFYRIRDKKG